MCNVFVGVLEGIAVASSILLHQQHQFESSQSTDREGMKRTSSFNGRTSPGLLLGMLCCNCHQGHFSSLHVHDIYYIP